MPPRPRSRLDIFLVPNADHEEAVKAVDYLWELGLREGVFGPDGIGNVGSDRWVEGGFSSLLRDESADLRWYHSGQGGTRVFCPVSGDNVVPAFNAQMSEYRTSGALDFVCPACGNRHLITELAFRPNACFGHAALVFRDVGAGRLTEDFSETVRGFGVLFSVVLHRPSY